MGELLKQPRLVVELLLLIQRLTPYAYPEVERLSICQTRVGRGGGLGQEIPLNSPPQHLSSRPFIEPFSHRQHLLRLILPIGSIKLAPRRNALHTCCSRTILLFFRPICLLLISFHAVAALVQRILMAHGGGGGQQRFGCLTCTTVPAFPVEIRAIFGRRRFFALIDVHFAFGNRACKRHSIAQELAMMAPSKDLD